MQHALIKLPRNSGFSLIEILVVIAISGLLSAITLGVFVTFQKSKGLSSDTETVVETLRQARSQSLSSKDSSAYGVHFSTSKITLFTGSTYATTSSSNLNFDLVATDAVLSISLFGGGSNVVFNRVTGETGQYGTVVISSPSASLSKTVTIYKTGVVDSQ
ncbi:MAG: seg [Candidatus Taylorbacteria bacterium]|nr:seg [Candidatus Taylorbacteria bacterium]